ncbi:tRNA1(Val) (adenine(37)-N6)-methyltransferase [uncultured Draconibacterium sp.]|uniref:tRNA1(Val) (adenine(37)-N6)-methyltransferase n=1 Tax=uncultured Draconibacterium sp. TaxID=1573823 RepID=UPI0029C75A14|nr:tRNA1(Val) (adenine(37)-N6)-methyltransferase [uncultured Draconibacterium sp.]
MGRNNYFQFKQFRIEQKRSAMKVGIDGILLGAWADVHDCNTILDIGTGTGLIALMLAQRSKARITAIEIEKNAAEEASENVAASPWEKRVDVQNVSLQNFAAGSNQQFDLIVSNPPFFQNSLKAGNENRSLARHTDSLPYKTLMEITSTLLTEEGRCAFIFPAMALKEIENLAPLSQLYLKRITMVAPNENKPVNRILVEMSKKENSTEADSLQIYNNDGSWNDNFKRLTRDYYLNF